MKTIVFIALFTILLGVAYSLGYSKGGRDFALLDHVLIGQLSHLEVQRCEAHETPSACYKWNEENNFHHSFNFYTHHHHELSPLASVMFEETYEPYVNAVKYINDQLQEDGTAASCEYLTALGDKAMIECQTEADEFIKLVRLNSND
jgi:hypothetical protein